MDWTQVIMLSSCLVTILGSPIAFALYLGNKFDSLSSKIDSESKDFHARLSVIESTRKSGKG